MTRYPTITDAAAALRAGEVTCVELTEDAIETGDATDRVGSFVNRFNEQALAAALAADDALAAGAPAGPLHGIPLGIKDIIATREAPATAQSLVLDPGWHPGDAVAVSRLRAAGGIVLAKTTTMEFAIGIPDASKPFPVPRNPWNLGYWAGGSSSGSGSAVATGGVLGALGTDTGASVRIPAAFCGVTGLMASFGRVPKSGCVPVSYTLDRIGPMARSARDCALMLSVLAGHDASDPCSIDEPVPDYAGKLGGDLAGLRIGVDTLTRVSGGTADPACPGLLASAVSELRALGAEIVEVELPLYAEMHAAHTVIMYSDALAYHLPDLRTRWAEYSAGTRATLGRAALFSAADYVQAQRVRRAGQKALAELYRDVDLIVTPTSSAAAPSLAVLDSIVEEASSGHRGPVHTQYWNMTGNPVISVPMGFTGNGLPLGMQIAGRPFDEAAVLRAADAYQARTQWHLQLPQVTASPA